MTYSANSFDASSSAASAATSLDRGTILQRGGEELALEKVSDRFTLRPLSKDAVSDLAQQIQAAGAQLKRIIPTAQIAELLVDPTQQEQVMQRLRQLASVGFVSHVYRVQNNPATLLYLTDEITIQFAPEVSGDRTQAIAIEVGLQLITPVAGIANTFVAQVTPQATENPIKIANLLMQRSEVLTAEPNIVVEKQPLYVPRDPLFAQQWYLSHNGGSGLAAGAHIAADKAWDITRGNRSIVVAILDDSFDLNHPDFQGKGKIVAPRDLRDKDFLPLPDGNEASHGTACAGIAIAEENGVGIAGVAPGCALMPIRTSGYLDDTSVEQAFNWAVEKGADVISCSWGPSAVYFPLSLRQKAAITRAASQGRNGKGCVILFAAGNANRPINGTVIERPWPGNALSGSTTWLTGFAIHPDVIAISASTSMNKKAAYSNWGENIALCAPSNNAPPGMWLQQTGFVRTPPELTMSLPGKGVLTTDQLGAAGYDAGDFTNNFGGTSSACPTVAGVAALVLSVNPNLTAAQVRQILEQTADKIVDPDPDAQFGFRKGTYEANGHSQWFGYGKINAHKAVLAAQQQLAATVPPAASRRIQQRNATNIAIPDGNLQGITSRIELTEASLIRDIQVLVAIDHSFLGDLEVYLLAPTNQTILLQSRNLGRRQILQTTYSPQIIPLLQTLMNQPARGTWQLKIIDYVPGDTGTLKEWQLILGV